MTLFLTGAVERLTLKYSKDPDSDTWTAQVVEHPGAISQGSDMSVARLNVLDALITILAADEELPDD